jgi:hypothetical protein
VNLKEMGCAETGFIALEQDVSGNGLSAHLPYFIRVYPKVSGLAAWSENCK